MIFTHPINRNYMKITKPIQNDWMTINRTFSLSSCRLRRRPALWPVGGAVTDSVGVNPPRVTGAGCAAAVCDSRPGAAAPSAGSAGSAGVLYHDSSSPRRCCALCADGIPRCLCSARASVPSAAGWRPGAAEETVKNPSQRFAELPRTNKKNKFSKKLQMYIYNRKSMRFQRNVIHWKITQTKLSIQLVLIN